jgi:hypothetical protein
MSTCLDVLNKVRSDGYKPAEVTAQELSALLNISTSAITGQFNPTHNAYASKHPKQPYEPIRIRDGGNMIVYDALAALCWRIDSQNLNNNESVSNGSKVKVGDIKARIAMLEYMQKLGLIVDLSLFTVQLTGLLQASMLRLENSLSDVALKVSGLECDEIEAVLRTTVKESFMEFSKELETVAAKLNEGLAIDGEINQYLIRNKANRDND